MTLFILGLDGASLDNLKVAMSRIDLPNFRKILAIGQPSPLRSAYPCVTGPAWTSLFSGVNPGKHGIFDQFSYRGANIVPANMRETKTPLLWDYLTWAGKRILVMGVPFVYPAPKVNGIFVTGTFSPKLSSYPADLAQKYDLSGFDYDKVTAEQAFETILKSGSLPWSEKEIGLLKRRMKVCSELIDSEPWDVVIIVDALPDEIFHIAGGNTRVEDEMFHGLDEWIGTILSRMKEEDNFLLVSDHGFSPIREVVFINEWLRLKGYLPQSRSVRTRMLFGLGFNWDLFSRPGPTSWAYAFALRHFPATLSRLTNPLRKELLLENRATDGKAGAFALSSGGPVAWVRVKGGKGETATAVEESVINDLGELKRAGVLKNVFRVDELYRGKFVPKAPGTILIESADGLAIDTRRMFTGKTIGRPLLTKTGDHRMHGIFVYVGKSVLAKGLVPQVCDIAPTALALLDIPAPMYLDGRNLLRADGEEDWKLNVPETL